MNINSTIFLQIVVFLILAWFTMKYVWPPIAQALDERAAKIAEGLTAADKAKTELAAANRKVEAELTQSRTEAASMVADAEKRGASIVDDAKERAQVEADKIVAAAKEEAQQQLVKAKEELRERVGALAVKGAEQILRKEVDASAHADMLQRLKEEL